MSKYDWEAFLQKWNKVLIESVSFAEYLKYPSNHFPDEYASEVLASGWLGYPGATEEQLLELEKRLGKSLPPSYREFLKATNGWRYAGNRIPRIWSIEKIDWLIAANQESIEAWKQGAEFGLEYSDSEPDIPSIPDEEYFVYGYDQFTYNFRFEYLDNTLEISDHEIAGTGVYMLNPQVVFPDGEWEAWFYAHWLPGAIRYQSFWELMQAEYSTFLANEEAKKWQLAHQARTQKKPGLLSKILGNFKSGKSPKE